MSITADKVIVELEARLGKYNADVNAARANFDQNMGKIRTAAVSTERQTELSAARIGQAFGRELIARASVAAVVAGLFQIGAAASKVARDAEELDSAIGFTFGKNSAMIQAWADSTGESLGRASSDLKQAALDFQTLFGPAMGADKAAEMSKQFAVLVQDLSSFRNVSEDIVRQNLVSGLVGETEPLRKFGIIINDNTVKAKALEMGLVSAGEEVNDYGKIVARAQLILEATAAAQGDVARTSGSTTNKFREAQSATKELAETIGSELNPGLAFAADMWTAVAKAAEWATKKQQDYLRIAGAVAKALMAGPGQLIAQREYEQARKRAAAEGRTMPTWEESQAAARLPTPTGANNRDRGSLARIRTNAATVDPSIDYSADGPSRGGSGSGARAKPRYSGPLPDYVAKGVAEGRYTEASIREAYPDGNFPMQGGVIFAEPVTASGPGVIEGGYDASEFSRGQAEDMKTSGDRMAEAIGPATEAYATMRENFASAFADGTISALQSGDVGEAVKQMLLQWGADGLRGALEGLGRSIFDIGGGDAASGGGGLGDIASAIFKLIPGFASGTSSAPGGLAYVHKDELINLPRGSQVYTAAQTRAMTRGGGSGAVQVNINLAGANGDRTIAAIARQATMEGVSAGLNAANRSETGRRVTETFLGARPIT